LSWLPAAAFIGASAVGLIVYLLAYKNGASTFRLVLIGIGFSMSAQAMTTLLMIKGPIYRASQANVYITGSVYGSNWQHVKIAIILSVILLFICFVALKNM
ncbi:iron chelate uptake ABC transporter family permease subunit, partial [Bacillus subtilis]